MAVTDGDDVAITVPSSDGTHTVPVTLSGIDSSSPTTVTFQLRGQTTGGETIMSNTYTVTVRTVQLSEFGYYGIRPTNDFSTVSLSELTQFNVTQAGTVFNIPETSWPSQQYLGIVLPNDRELVRLTNPNAPDPTSNILGDFVTTTDARTENSVTYTTYTEQNLSSFTGTIALQGTTE